jgi:hypothetical protein
MTMADDRKWLLGEWLNGERVGEVMVMDGPCQAIPVVVVPEARALAAEGERDALREGLVEALAYVPEYFIERHDMRAPLASVSKERLS